jgi:hypothetical protein
MTIILVVFVIGMSLASVRTINFLIQRERTLRKFKRDIEAASHDEEAESGPWSSSLSVTGDQTQTAGLIFGRAPDLRRKRDQQAVSPLV